MVKMYAAVAALVFLCTAGAGRGAPLDDELPASLDNGAQGRDPFHSPGHVPPIDACHDALRPSNGSLVVRMLPRGPLAPDGALAFTSGVCVYLPPGYARSHRRYPVLYLLHGGGGDAADWVTFGDIRKTMDDLIAADRRNAAIVVMPDGDDAQWYDSLDGTIANQQYVLDWLVPYVDRHLRTIAGREGRAIDGLSNGGYGAMHLAAKAPDRFVVAGGMSSNLGALSMAGLRPTDAPAYSHGSLPVDLAGNLDGIDLMLDIGTSCVTDQAIDQCFAFQFEQIFVPANRDFLARLASLRGPTNGQTDYRETEGAHAWRWWGPWLRDRHLPFLLARLADPRRSPRTRTRRPTAFGYRSIAVGFSVWGWDVTVDRGVREFLDLTNVGAGGLHAQGSGQVHIRTPPLYRSGRAYVVTGAGAAVQRVTADRAGRLAFVVDLGPAHEHEQYTPAATALEGAGGYWSTRDVTIGRR